MFHHRSERPRKALEGLGDVVRGGAGFSPDGRFLVARVKGREGPVATSIVDVEAAAQVARLATDGEAVIDPSSRRLLVRCPKAGGDTLQLVELASGRRVVDLGEHIPSFPPVGTVLDDLRFSADGDRLVLPGGDAPGGQPGGRVALRVVAIEPLEVATIDSEVPVAKPTLLAFAAGGTRLIVAGPRSSSGKNRRPVRDSGLLELWDVDAPRRLATSFSPDGRRRATVDPKASALKVWDVASAALRGEVSTRFGVRVPPGTLPPSPVSEVVFGPDNRHVAFRVRGQWRLADVEGGAPTAAGEYPGPDGAITALAVSPAGALVAAGGADATACLRDAATGRVAAVFDGFDGPPAALAFAPDGRSLAVGDAAGQLTAWRLERGPTGGGPVVAELAWKGAGPRGPAHAGGVLALAYRPDGRQLATVGKDGALRFWDPADGRPARSIDLNGGELRCVAYRPDGRVVAVAGAAGRVRLVDGAGASIRSWDAGQEAVAALAFDPAAPGLLATAGRDVRLWDAARGELLLTLTGHVQPARTLAFSRDGARLASGGEDHAAYVLAVEPIRLRLMDLGLGW